MAIIMAPNIIYAVKHKDDPALTYRNKKIEIAEQIGRYGCFILMIFNIPHTYFNFWFDYALEVYLIVNGLLCFAYLLFWLICYKQSGLLKAVSLSVIPSFIFLFSGIILAYIPLIVFAVLFGITHIFISCKSALQTRGKRRKYTVKEKLTNETIALLIILLLVCAVISFWFGTEII